MKPLVTRITRYLKVYFLFVKFSLQDILIFRINALIMGLAPIVWFATVIIFLVTLFSRIKNLGGWSFWEIVFLTGVHEIIFLLTWMTFVQNLRRFVHGVRKGDFDYQLLRPINPRFTISFRLLDFTNIGSIMNVIVIFALSLVKVMPQIHFSRIGGFLVFLILAYLICYLVYFIFASFALVFIRAWSLLHLLFDTTDFSRFPAEIYPRTLKTFLTFFLPILFFSYYPTAFLLGKISWVYLPLGILVVVWLFILSGVVWRWGLRHYQSASS